MTADTLSVISVTKGSDWQSRGLGVSLGLDAKADIMERLGWLGLFEQTAVAIGTRANVDVLVDLMLRRLSYGPGEKDMIIVHDEITAELAERKERRSSKSSDSGSSTERCRVATPEA